MNIQPNSQLEEARLSALWDLLQATQEITSLEEFDTNLLDSIGRLSGSEKVALYVADPRFPDSSLFTTGFQPSVLEGIEGQLAQRFQQALQGLDASSLTIPVPTASPGAGTMTLWQLVKGRNLSGLLGLEGDINQYPPALMERLVTVLTGWIDTLAIRWRADRQLAQLNTYLTVSSMMSQSQGLHESLEVALYCCMEAVEAETASVLLLDDDHQNFRFYHVEGPSKLVLETTAFPADQGLAGSVLSSRQSEVINDVQHDPRFYGKVDQDSGFQTLSMIAVPLVAGEEPVGVLEVLNKVGGDGFSEEEHLLLLSIAEEIAFAIRNAKVFEYVVNGYCKQRQGLNSCRGCERPLGSWTPCVRYREAEL